MKNKEMISYYNQGTNYKLKHKRSLSNWINQVVHLENSNFSIGNINVVLCDDEYVLDINKQFLNHNYYTDIITFDYCEDTLISGDLMISIDTVKSNAKEYDVPFIEELYRVIAHGVLHLLGYKDSTENEKSEMRVAENNALILLKSIIPF
ncbi:MAG: rRNA maturation RNase YbeY [Bacteroidales bacterium]|nr:rRNA maturation RNase YbeY [Bacteroidales bacterium]MDD3299650.1 rRNA maturation RNase YbeY [Bacteroidales bacterium]MDD3843626.1 rRNA maturation RNase YbeY [Bacteroidales bacterium]MDD4618500.1 rRNA maturation RNase YbeY [Bacteroidales bacterium]